MKITRGSHVSVLDGANWLSHSEFVLAFVQLGQDIVLISFAAEPPKLVATLYVHLVLLFIRRRLFSRQLGSLLHFLPYNVKVLSRLRENRYRQISKHLRRLLSHFLSLLVWSLILPKKLIRLLLTQQDRLPN